MKPALKDELMLRRLLLPIALVFTLLWTLCGDGALAWASHVCCAKGAVHEAPTDKVRLCCQEEVALVPVHSELAPLRMQLAAPPEPFSLPEILQAWSESPVATANLAKAWTPDQSNRHLELSVWLN